MYDVQLQMDQSIKGDCNVWHEIFSNSHNVHF